MDSPLRSRVLMAVAIVVLPIRLQAGDPDYRLEFSTYLGGSRWDHARDVVTDSQDNIIMVGGTAGGFPVTSGAYDTQYNDGVNKGPYAGGHSGCDAFVAKFSPDGTLLWASYLGGPNYDRAYAVEVDSHDNIILSGRAGPDFPTTAGAFQQYTGADIEAAKGFYGIQNAFVAKLSADGKNLLWASYVGKGELCRGVDVDANDDVYVSFSTEQQVSPVEIDWFETAFSNAFMPSPPGAEQSGDGRLDAGVAKIKSDGSRVLWATWMGGSGRDQTNANVRVDREGCAYLTMVTDSTDLPTTVGAHSRSYFGGASDIHLSKFSADGSELLAATYLGTDGDELFETHPNGLDRDGDVFVGYTSVSTSFEATPSAYQSGIAGTHNMAVSKLSPTFQLSAQARIGGSSNDAIDGISVDAFGKVLVSGASQSTDFPVSGDAFQASLNADHDAVVAVFSNDLTRLHYATFLGGSDYDLFRGSYIDAKGCLYAAGASTSNDLPTLNATQASYGGSNDPRWGNGDAVLAVFKDANLFAGDSEPDFLPDDWEMANFGSLDETGEGDKDGDGNSNRLEFLQGTDPEDENSHLTAWLEDRRTLRFAPTSDLVEYSALWAHDLAQNTANWNRLPLAASGDGGFSFALPDVNAEPFNLSASRAVFFVVGARPAF